MNTQEAIHVAEALFHLRNIEEMMGQRPRWFNWVAHARGELAKALSIAGHDPGTTAGDVDMLKLQLTERREGENG